MMLLATIDDWDGTFGSLDLALTHQWEESVDCRRIVFGTRAMDRLVETAREIGAIINIPGRGDEDAEPPITQYKHPMTGELVQIEVSEDLARHAIQIHGDTATGRS